MEFQTSAGNVNSGLKISRPADQRLTDIQIPTSVTTASFLKHTALTPAQRKYLYSIAASYSTEHVRSLVTQHYMNVQYRCIRADYNHKRDILEASVASPGNDREDHLSKTQSEVSSRSKNKSKISARLSGKPSLPKNKEARSQDQTVRWGRRAGKTYWFSEWMSELTLCGRMGWGQLIWFVILL